MVIIPVYQFDTKTAFTNMFYKIKSGKTASDYYYCIHSSVYMS